MKPDEIQKLRDQLAEIPTLYSQLPHWTDPHTERTPDPDSEKIHSDSAPGSPALINLEIFHLRDTRKKLGWREHQPGRVATIHRFGVLPTLSWWTGLLWGEMADRELPRPPIPPVATVTSECAWLQETLMFTLTTRWVDLLAADIDEVHGRLAAATTGSRPFKPRCDACGARLQAEEGWYRCPSCQRTYTQASKLDRERPRPGREIAAALDIPWNTIRSWDARGIIRAKGVDAHRRKLYLVADVRRAAERIRTPRSKK